MEINSLIDVVNTAGLPPTDSSATLTMPYIGTIGYTDTIGDESASDPLKGKTAGCFLNGATGNYVFYRVLWLQ